MGGSRRYYHQGQLLVANGVAMAVGMAAAAAAAVRVVVSRLRVPMGWPQHVGNSQPAPSCAPTTVGGVGRDGGDGRRWKVPACHLFVP